jgi:hypothetical protein
MSAEVLRARLTAARTRSPRHVIDAFAAATGTLIEDLAGPSKTPSITQLRHELMFLLRALTHLSQTEIGRYLGGRDMSTVHVGVARIADRVAAEPEFRARMRLLQDKVLEKPGLYVSPGALSSAEMAVRVAHAVLADAGISDDEARRAATGILAGYLGQTASQPHPTREAGA